MADAEEIRVQVPAGAEHVREGGRRRQHILLEAGAARLRQDHMKLIYLPITDIDLKSEGSPSRRCSNTDFVRTQTRCEQCALAL